MMDVNERYSSSLASLLSSAPGSLPHSCNHPRAINQDFILAHGTGVSQQQHLMGMDKSLSLGSTWNPVDSGNLSLTSSKSAYALQGVGLPSSPPIAPFSSNLGFAERAARFSTFSNAHFSQSFPLSDTGSIRQVSPHSYDNETKSAKAPIRAESASGSMSSPDVSCRSQANGLEGTVQGEDTVKRNRRLFRNNSSPAAGCSTDEGCSAPELETAVTSGPSESGVTANSRGQEISSPDAEQQGKSTAATQLNGQKRKSSGDEAVNDVASPVTKDQKTSAHSKRTKSTEDKDTQKAKAERSDTSCSSLQAAKDSKQVDHPKTDYIHVRARRGQATDSHSLAERVRREKISERMKFLQDLVPGCSKVTGKAVMLDEIINYVQSIQRQVEFLSMKLAAVTPRPDFNIDSFLAKQLQMGQNCGLQNVIEHPHESSIPFSHVPQFQSLHPANIQQSIANSFGNPNCVDPTLRRTYSTPVTLARLPLDSFGDGLSQIPALWEGDLHSVVEMGLSQGKPTMGLSGYQCHMKVEL
ncbi:hypothetical protein R1flu_007915 [Riccia fluitans]|uniref:BHLH domain-containing protein n=1 Tax=Riccia fluitans TaxID=41844 RepID=A0ABD1Z068_9MARC